MKVLFIVPPLYTEETYGKFARVGSTMPFLGMCYLAGVLRRNRFKVKILDTIVLKLSLNDILKKITNYKPQIIGIYASTTSYCRAKSTAEKIKELFPDTKIIIGGPHLSACAEEVMNDNCFDFGVIDEGEETVLELCDKLRDKKESDLKNVKGLIFKNEKGEIVKTAKRNPIKEIDKIPFPARDLLPPLKLYLPSALYHKKIPVMQIFTSRGCPYRCIFCETPFGKIIRFHSVDYVISEIEMLIKNFDVKEIIVNDDTFTVSKKRVFEICRQIRKKKIKIVWSCNIRVNAVDKEILQEMKSAGCWLIMPGVESGNQKILDILRKGITLEQVINTCRWAEELGLMVKPSFICGNPGDTKQTIEQTINFAKSLKTHYPSYTFMTPFPGTDMWNFAEQYGTIDKKDYSKFALSSAEPSFVPWGLTKEDLIKKQAEAFKKWYLDWDMLYRHLKIIRSLEDVNKMLQAGLTLFLSSNIFDKLKNIYK